MGKERLTQTDTLPNGELIDLDSYDWENLKMTKKQKLFVIWYTLPGQEGFQNATKAASKAGYTPKTSVNAKFDLLKKYPNVTTLIEKFSQNFIKVSLQEATKKLIQQKINRATYNVKDYYELKEIENPETGETRTITAVKPITELTREQAELIDNIEITNTGIPTYKLPNKERETNEIIKMANEMNKTSSGDDYDVETTVDMVREQLATVKTTIRFNNQKIKENAQNYIENSENLPEFD